MNKIAAGLAVAGLLILGALAGPASATGQKVTICHAAGQDGTTHYVELTISVNAVYGPGGHFNENGTPQAGHEDDYLGSCRAVPTPTPATPTPTPTPTPAPTPTPRPTPTTGGETPAPTPNLTLPPTDTGG